MRRIGRWLFPTVTLALVLAGCKSNQTPTQSPQDQSQNPPAADDPASANLAPASNTTAAPSQENPPAPPADQPSAAPRSTAQPSTDQSGYEQAPPPDDDQYGDDYSETVDYAAPQPPPEIPQYDQPPAPGPNYIWTPGYWAYASQGYYWVPGAWVLAPYVGALWTPGYWGWDNNRYTWHHGYWGTHIGFYGGVNYGHGYDGNGYEGGYWRDHDFYYNRSVSRVDNHIHNVYEYRVQRNFNNSRVAYNGGRGGLNYRPTPRQEEARNERHFAPLPAQHRLAQTAQQNREQFARRNHGKPQNFADNRPVDEGRKAPAPRPEDFHGAPEIHPHPAAKGPNFGPLNVPRPQPGRPAVNHQPRQESHPQTRAPENRNVPAPHGRPTNRPEPHNQPARTPQTRTQAPKPNPPAVARPQPASHPDEPRSQSQPRRNESHPQNQPRPQQESHPQSRSGSSSRSEAHPAPQHKQESRPQPHKENKPENKPGENHPHE